MKPFLTIRSPELPSFDEWDETMHPFGDYYDTNPAFLNSKEEYLIVMDVKIKQAKTHFAEMKKMGAAAAGCDGVDEAWAKVCLQPLFYNSPSVVVLTNSDIEHFCTSSIMYSSRYCAFDTKSCSRPDKVEVGASGAGQRPIP